MDAGLERSPKRRPKNLHRDAGRLRPRGRWHPCLTRAATPYLLAALVAAAAGLYSMGAGAAASPPAFFQAASLGIGAEWDSIDDELRLSLDKASVTVAGVLDRWLPGNTITVGRQAWQWGPGLSGSLLLSGSTPLDGVSFLVSDERLRYEQLAAARDASKGKWLLAHRIAGRLGGVEVGISEACSVSSGFHLQPYHLIPGCPYFLAQHLSMQDERTQDWWSNVLAAVDASLDVTRGVKLYGEFMADDFPWAPSARGRVPYMVGGLAGVHIEVPHQANPCRVAMEYVRINNYVYSHKNPENTYVVGEDKPIGHPLGPDADALYLFVSRSVGFDDAIGPCRNIEVTGRLGYERHGEGVLGHAWSSSEGVNREFLAGTVETRASLGVWATGQLGSALRAAPGAPHCALVFATVVERVRNAGHVPSAEAFEASVRLSLKFVWGQ
ncbi:MAG: hypothetical protein ACM3X3_06970 [Betaproteobacteria bacterium]